MLYTCLYALVSAVLAISATAQAPEQHHSTPSNGPKFQPGTLSQGVIVYNRTDYHQNVALHWYGQTRQPWTLELHQTRDDTLDGAFTKYLARK